MIWQAIEANLKSVTSCELKSLVSLGVQKVLSQIYKSILKTLVVMTLYIPHAAL